MNLVINSYDGQLKKEKGMFEVVIKDKLNHLSPSKIKSICLTNGCLISTDAINLAIQHNIPIVMMKRNGDPIGRLWSHQFGSIGTIRRQQVLFTMTTEATDWVIAQYHRKTQAQASLLETMEKRKKSKGKKEDLLATLKYMREQDAKAYQLRGRPIFQIENKLRGLEGSIAKAYFQAISRNLPKEYRFDRRSRKPAKDVFNVILNYCYGMLYNAVEQALLAAGLDPAIAILHGDQYNKPTFSFDFIERFRPWADWTAYELCASKAINQEEHTEIYKNGLWLNKKGRQIVISAFNGLLDRKTTMRSKRRKRQTHIFLEAQRFAQMVLETDFSDKKIMVKRYSKSQKQQAKGSNNQPSKKQHNNSKKQKQEAKPKVHKDKPKDKTAKKH